MAGGELWGVWAQTITNDTTPANVEKYGEIEDMAEAYRDGFAKDFCDGQTSPTPPRWPDDGMQLIYFYDRESAELVSQFLRGDIDDRIAGGMLAPTVTPSWSTAVEAVQPFVASASREEAIERLSAYLNPEADISLDSMSLDQLDTLAKVMENTPGAHTIRLDGIVVRTRETGFGNQVVFANIAQIDGKMLLEINPTFLTDPEAVISGTNIQYDLRKSIEIQRHLPPYYRTISEFEAAIASGESESTGLLNRIHLMQDTPHWNVAGYRPERALEIMVEHETQHAVYIQNDLAGAFETIVREERLTSISVLSEYSRANADELFAEIGAARYAGIPIQPELLEAYEAVMKGAGLL